MKNLTYRTLFFTLLFTSVSINVYATKAEIPQTITENISCTRIGQHDTHYWESPNYFQTYIQEESNDILSGIEEIFNCDRETVWAISLLCFFIFLLIILSLIILYIVIPVKMAHKRGRNGVGWVLITLLTSPLLSIIILACLGETEKKRRTRILEEEEIKLEAMRRYNLKYSTNLSAKTPFDNNDFNKNDHSRYMPQ